VDAMVQSLHYGLAEAISGPFLKQTPFYNADMKPLPYDPKQAIALLREAGWVQKNGKMVNAKTGEPFRFTLITNNGNDVRRGILTIAQQSWGEIGIEVSTQSVEWSVFIKKNVNQLDFDAIVLGWSMGIDPDLFQIWHSSQTGPGQLNFVGYQNPKADDLIVAIRSEYDRDRIKDYCHALHKIIADDQPYTFLTAPMWTAVLEQNIVRQIGQVSPPVYKQIESTPTGDYTYYFNEWIKIPKTQP